MILLFRSNTHGVLLQEDTNNLYLSLWMRYLNQEAVVDPPVSVVVHDGGDQQSEPLQCLDAGGNVLKKIVLVPREHEAGDKTTGGFTYKG